MIEFIKSLYDKENDEELYVFNVTHTICVIGMVLVCVIVRLFFDNPIAIYLSFATSVLFLLTMAEANRTRKLKPAIIFMSIVFNFLYMPEMYYMFDRSISVMPVYFLFGLMYSVILLDAKTAIVLGGIETIFYSILLFLFNGTMPTGLEQASTKDIYTSYMAAIVSIIIVGLCAGCTVRFRFMFHQRAQEEAEILKAEAMDAYIAKDMFLINMSHEIRTPMNAIVGTVDLLLDQDVSEHVSDSIYNILNSCNALLSLTDELMDLSKSENGEVSLYVATYDLSDLLMEVVNMMTVRLTESNLDFFVNINNSIPRFLYGDVSKLRQLFVNILNNAVKYTPSGKIILRVDCKPIDTDTIDLIVDVEDTGVGIKKEDMKNLFIRNEFESSVSENENENVDGSGLGLAICAEIINEMNGEITVQSEYRHGSVFTFKVPQRFTSMDTVAFVPDADSFRILVFEKDGDHAEHIRRILDSFNINSDYAWTRQDLERLINVNKYTHIFISNERYEECETVLSNRLIESNIVAFLDIDDNVHVQKATTVLTRPIHALNVASLLKNETNSYVREITRKGGFECPHATILVVDDNFTNLNVASAILSKYGANVITALSGKDCLRLLKDQDVDMIFLDYMMPEMNGIDTLENIRKMPGSRFASMPIIALTANVVSGAREMFLEAGFDDFMAKPISIDKMEKVLRKYLRRDLITAKNPMKEEQV
ncbi:MAG: response regulator [Lachnospiraceae bacterium]|nr:response regulator [Lachnospiraceae bacterium]